MKAASVRGFGQGYFTPLAARFAMNFRAGFGCTFLSGQRSEIRNAAVRSIVRGRKAAHAL
jgi:hypothetical protein